MNIAEPGVRNTVEKEIVSYDELEEDDDLLLSVSIDKYSVCGQDYLPPPLHPPPPF